MKCSWEAAFSLVVTPRHFAANVPGARVGAVIARSPPPLLPGGLWPRMYASLRAPRVVAVSRR